MDFSDIVHKALHDKQSAADRDQARTASSASPAPLAADNDKLRPRPVDVGAANSLDASTPTSSGASPAIRERDTASFPSTPTHRPTAPPPHPAPANPSLNLLKSSHPPTSTKRASPAQSRSPSRRSTQADDYLLPPIPSFSSPPSSPPQGPSSPLGLDVPRPRHRSQASFNWFGDAASAPTASEGPLSGAPTLGAAQLVHPREDGEGGFFLANAGAVASPPQQQRTESPGRLDLSRSSSVSTNGGNQSAAGGLASPNGASAGGMRSPLRLATSPASPSASSASRSPSAGRRPSEPAKPRRRQSRTPQLTSGTEDGAAAAGAASASDWSDAEGPKSPGRRRTAEQRQGSGESSSDGPGGSTHLRGAFTAADLERGARILRGEEDDDPNTTAAGAGKSDGAGMPKSRAQGARNAVEALKRKTAEAVGAGGGGAAGSLQASKNRERRRSAGAAERDGAASGTTTPARPRSLHAAAAQPNGNGDAAQSDDWEDETRDQFDTDAPPHSRPGAGGAGTASSSRRGSLWGAGSPSQPHAHLHGGESGASTPREGASDDEGAGGGGGGGSAGPGPKRPSANGGAGAGSARRGSAWNVVRNKLGGVQPKKKKEKQGASLTGHELVAVRLPLPPLHVDDVERAEN